MGSPYRAAAKPKKRQGAPGIECFACGIVNQAHRQRCECGFDLRPKPDQLRRMLATQSDAKVVQIGIGIAAIAAASAFSYATYVGAVNSGGGSYFIFTGIIVYGLVKVVRGYRGLRDVRERQRRMQAAPPSSSG